MAVNALDLAERFQTPVFVLSDIDIGMNDWMVDELEWDDSYVPDRGKVLSSDDLDKMDKFHRYLDVDGDHIPYRTLPGTNPKGAYFTRGSGHNKWGNYTEDGQEYKEVVDRLHAKWKSAADKLPVPVITMAKQKTAHGIISLGSCDGAVLEACDKLASEGFYLDYLRVRGFPFSAEVEKFIMDHDEVFVVEQNRDAQLLNLLLTETEAERKKLISLLHYSGEPLGYRFVYGALKQQSLSRKSA